jgi:4-hydroxybenzoate polyprenyltransferase
MIREFIISMRPKQWYKNLIVLVGFIFSLGFFNPSLWLDAAFAFTAFCLLSGGGYIINDIFDVENDKKHSRKSKRPIASGKLRIAHAFIFSVMLIAAAFWISYLVNMQFLLVSFSYLCLMLIYTIYLKHVFLVDVLIISTGFVIRAAAGCVAISVLISPWLIICAFLLALFLALNKRRHEIIAMGDESKKHRKVLEKYSIKTIDHMIDITTATLLLSYSLYTFLAENIYMMLTIPFVIYGLFRYLYLINSQNVADPVRIFTDKGSLLNILLWAVLILLILLKIPQIFADFIFTL